MSVSEVFLPAAREKKPLVPREDAKENRGEKMAARTPGGELVAIFFLTALFRVTQDGLSERGTTRDYS